MEITENVSMITLSNGKTFPRKVYSAYSEEELREVIACCKNYKDILQTLQLNMFYHKYLKKFVEENNIDISHFKQGLACFERKIKIQDKLVKGDKHVGSADIKAYLVKNNLVENKCSVCNLPPVWNNKPLTLQLDHINGDHFDNRVENLRLICPNCHTQTETFTGRNNAKYQTKKCSICKIKDLRSENISGKCAKCITKEKKDGICSQCKVNNRHRSYLRCKNCIKSTTVVEKKCKGCDKPINRNYNKSEYHNRCFKGIKKDGTVVV
jgi:hypothetical protein